VRSPKERDWDKRGKKIRREEKQTPTARTSGRRHHEVEGFKERDNTRKKTPDMRASSISLPRDEDRNAGLGTRKTAPVYPPFGALKGDQKKPKVIFG